MNVIRRKIRRLFEPKWKRGFRRHMKESCTGQISFCVFTLNDNGTMKPLMTFLNNSPMDTQKTKEQLLDGVNGKLVFTDDLVKMGFNAIAIPIVTRKWLIDQTLDHDSMTGMIDNVRDALRDEQEATDATLN